jgi:Uma2 family endonuclease
MSVGVIRSATGLMSGAAFRSFQETRPDHERWELVEGVPIMMVPPTIAHQRIAGNLERLLNDALVRHDATRIAVQGAGVELGDAALAPIGEDFRPEPDVIVMDVDYEPRQRFVSRAYLVAEIVSDTDIAPMTRTGEPWIAVKRRLYLAHEPCATVLLIDPYRIDIKIDRRARDGWIAGKLTGLGDELNIPSCGLCCLVADIYEGTPLNRRHGNRRNPAQ